MSARSGVVWGISMLTLGFAVSANAGDGWTRDAKGCKVWYGGPKPGETVQWSGSCVNGFSQGNGEVTWYKAGKQVRSVEGGYVAGLPTGPGAVSYENGGRYVGGLSEGKRHGSGRMVYPDGSVYEGGFYLDEKRDQGTFTRADGTVETGSFFNDHLYNGKIVGGDGQLQKNVVAGNVIDVPKVRMDAEAETVQRPYESSASSGSSLLAMLGAAVQGVAVAGGKSSAQIQALGAAMQGNSPSSAQSGYSSNQKGGAAAGGRVTRPGKMANECLKVSFKDIDLKNVASLVTNTCGFGVVAVYCENASSDVVLGGNLCAKGRGTGAFEMAPGYTSQQGTYLTARGVAGPSVGACQAPAYPENIRYSSNSISFSCVIDDTPTIKGVR